MSTTRPKRASRADFVTFRALDTRWGDIDVYGHVNNVVYYAWFDSAVCGWLVAEGLSDPLAGETLTFVVNTGCTYFEAIGFPETIEVGLKVTALGLSSVTFALGVFRAGQSLAAAQGHFTHVHVARSTRRPVPIPHGVRAALQRLRCDADAPLLRETDRPDLGGDLLEDRRQL